MTWYIFDRHPKVNRRREDLVAVHHNGGITGRGQIPCQSNSQPWQDV